MEKYDPKSFSININPEAPLFVIGVVAEMVDIPIWTLRKLDEMGVVQPERKGKKVRCYSKKQVEVLSYVHYLMEEKGVNISGIRVILEMRDQE
jgi:DNA-binding transcriptional MerR regulator